MLSIWSRGRLIISLIPSQAKHLSPVDLYLHHWLPREVPVNATQKSKSHTWEPYQRSGLVPEGRVALFSLSFFFFFLPFFLSFFSVLFSFVLFFLSPTLRLSSLGVGWHCCFSFFLFFTTSGVHRSTSRLLDHRIPPPPPLVTLAGVRVERSHFPLSSSARSAFRAPWDLG